MTETTKTKWEQITAALRCSGGSFEDVMREIERLKKRDSDLLSLRTAAGAVLRYTRFTEAGRIKCCLCTAEWYGEHTGACPIQKLRDLAPGS